MSLVSFLVFSLDIDSHIYKQRDTDQLPQAFLLAKAQTHPWVSGPHFGPSRKSTRATHHPCLAGLQLLLKGPASKYLPKQFHAFCWGEGPELSLFSKGSLTTNPYMPVQTSQQVLMAIY